MIYSLYEATEEHGMTYEQYYQQFSPIKLELGKTYVQHPGSWQEQQYLIVYVGHGVAVGISEHSTFGTNRDLFISEGLRGGWRNDDGRPQYRLQK